MAGRFSYFFNFSSVCRFDFLLQIVDCECNVRWYSGDCRSSKGVSGAVQRASTIGAMGEFDFLVVVALLLYIAFTLHDVKKKVEKLQK